MRASTRAAWLIAASALLLAAPARAGSSGPTPAELVLARDLLRDAIAEQKAGRCDDAIAMLRQAAAIRPTAEGALRLGECLEAKGALRDALGAVEEAASLARAGTDRALDRPIAAKLDVLREKVPRLEIDAGQPPRDLQVIVDGRVLRAEELDAPIRVDPGEHVVRAEAQGRRPFERRARVAEGESVIVAVRLEPLRGAGAQGGGVPLATWIGGGAALALGAGGAVAFLAAGGAAEDGSAACAKATRCDEADANRVRALDAAALGLWIGAGVGATVAVTALVLRVGGDRAPATAALSLGPTGAAITARY
jgi:tetratricopeptide (TPR) repeat protein